MDKTRLVSLFLGMVVFSSVVFPSAIQASVGVSPSAVSFGTVAVNSTSSTTLVVVNNSVSNISLTSVQSSIPQVFVSGPALPFVLRPGASASFQVAFQPSSATTFSGSIIFKAGHKNSQGTSVPVSGTGINAAPPAATYLLTPSVSSLAFGNQLVGASSSHPFTLTNAGTGSLNISQVTYTGTGFSVSGFSGTAMLAPGQSLSLSANFAPAVVGAASGSVSVVSTATGSPAVIALSGTGVEPSISVIPTSVAFGNVSAGATNTQTITVRNPGTATLTISQASSAGAGYSVSGLATPLSIAAGSSSSFNVGFAPASAGSSSGSLTLTSNAPNSPTAVALTGSGVASTYQLSANPTALSFGSLSTGTSGTQTVTLTNTGNTGVTISQITAGGTGFSLSTIALPVTLSAGQSTSFNVAFAPASVGSVTGNVTVTSNANNSPMTLSLSGTGAAATTHSVSLNWTPSSTTYSGFNVYRSSVSGGPYAKVDGSLILTSSYTDSSVSSGQTYYYVATEMDSTGMESGYSSEVSAAIP